MKDDGCLGGAANIIAIPDDGTATPVREFQNAVKFPGSATTGISASLQLIPPFKTAELVYTMQTPSGLVLGM